MFNVYLTLHPLYRVTMILVRALRTLDLPLGPDSRAWLSADGAVVALTTDGAFHFDSVADLQRATGAAVLEVRGSMTARGAQDLAPLQVLNLLEAVAVTGYLSGPHNSALLRARGWARGVLDNAGGASWVAGPDAVAGALLNDRVLERRELRGLLVQ